MGDEPEIQRLLASLRIQVLSLESRLERELLANHLLKNAKALIFAGAWLDAPESARWRALGEALLREQMSEQILPDGGHIERSPMYHAWILDHMLDINNLFESSPPENPGCSLEVSRCIKHMAGYMNQILHPDGEIPLLNDSQLGVTRPAAAILEEAGMVVELEDRGSATQVRVLRDTGYGVLREHKSKSFLVFDCGALGPDYQPGHGHSDVLSYELSMQGQRVIVDTGVSSYEPGPERHYERSTAAHNTIRVDGEEQAEIWASFRVGRRPSVSPIRHGTASSLQFLQGTHYGYRHLGVSHSRAVVHLDSGSWVIVDRLRGRGTHKLESFIHFHPTIAVQPIPNIPPARPGVMTPRWSATFAGARYLLMTLGGGTLLQTEAWYSPGFAIRHPQAVIYWTWEGELPTTLLYAIVPEGSEVIPISGVMDSGGVEIDGKFIAL